VLSSGCEASAVTSRARLNLHCKHLYISAPVYVDSVYHIMAAPVQDETVARLSPLITSAIDALLRHKMEKAPETLLPSGAAGGAPITNQAVRVTATRKASETFPLPTKGATGLPEQHPLRFIAQYLMRHKNDAIATKT
jgi:hypothetical protein